MYLWQDWGPFGAFDPGDRLVHAPTPTASSPAASRVSPATSSPTAWTWSAGSGVLFIVVLLTGFYVWYWPGVRRWATALAIKRGRGAFTFNMSLHKVIGFVVWVPLLVVAFTGIAFAFPNLNSWYENATPAQRDFSLWTQPEDAVSEPRPTAVNRIDLDAALAAIEERYPDRAVQSLMPPLRRDLDLLGLGHPWLRPVDPGGRRRQHVRRPRPVHRRRRL